MTLHDVIRMIGVSLEYETKQMHLYIKMRVLLKSIANGSSPIHILVLPNYFKEHVTENT